MKAGLGAAEIIDYHDPNWPGQAGGGFDGALTAAIGTAEAALPLVRDGGRLCSLTSDAPAGERGIASADLCVRPDAAQLAQLAGQVSEGTLQARNSGNHHSRHAKANAGCLAVTAGPR